jgi:predicted Zn-dependent protease
VNAFIAPGGHIFVYAGLLKAVGRDDNMLAFVLAHEMGQARMCHHTLVQ